MRKIVLLTLLLNTFYIGYSQTGNVGVGTTTPNTKAALDVTATDKGFMLPRLTQAQRTSITGLDSTHKSLMVYQIDGTEGFYYFNGNSWNFLGNNTVATNGLTKNSDSIKLGGNLNENTSLYIGNKSFNISTSANAGGEALDQSQTTTNSTSASIVAQFFTPATSGYLTKITVNYKAGTGAAVRMNIIVGGTTYYSDYVTASTTAFADVDFTFTTQPYLTSGTQYSFNTPSGTYSYTTNTNSYTGGSIYFVSSGSGDLYFKTYMLLTMYNNLTIDSSKVNIANSKFVIDNTGNITKLNSVTYSFPVAQGTANQVLTNDGSGTLSWATANSGTVTSVTGTSPITVATGTSTPSISIAQANASTNGYLTSTDWNTFNNKQSTLGNASASVSGILTSTNFTTFNNKYGSGSVANLGAGTIIGTSGSSYSGLGLTLKNTSTSTFATNADVNDGNRFFSIVNEGSTANSYATLGFRVNPSGGTNNAMLDLKFVNPNNGSNRLIYSFRNAGSFGDKFEMTSTGSLGVNKIAPAATLDVNGTAIISGATTLSNLSGTGNRMVIADATGNLSTQAMSAGTVTTVSGTSPISIANNTTTPSISIAQANTSTNGYLTSTDWNTFNNKLHNVTNGISKNGDTVKLGGTLSQNTSIDNNYYDITFTNLAGASSNINAFNSNNFYTTNNGTTIYQTFTAINNATLLNVQIKASRTVSIIDAPTITLSLYEGSSGAAGTLIATATNSNTISSSSIATYTFNLPATALVTKQAMYSLVFTASNNNATISYTGNNFDYYTGGSFSYNNNPPSNYTDLAFIINGTTTTGKMGFGTATPEAMVSVGNSSQFQINETGNITKINNIGYSFPALQGSANQVLTNNGSGTLTWESVSAGTITNVTGTSPISVATGTSTPAISITQANTSTSGYLSNTDWNTFNNKQSALSNANTTTSGILTSTDWNTFNNKQSALSNANTTTSGILTSTDWNTFNNKVATTRSISTTAPLSGGGDLSANRTLSIAQATTSTDGYLSSTNWNTFNNKENVLTFSSPLNRSTNTISMPVATTSVSGYLSNTDWNTFNNKQNSLSAANTTTNGYLTSTDWNTFNNKANQTGVSNIIKTTVNQDIASIPAGSYIDEFFIVSGAAFGASVVANPASGLSGGIIIAWCRVSAANQVQIRFQNVTGSAINEAAQDYQITVIKN